MQNNENDQMNSVLMQLYIALSYALPVVNARNVYDAIF